MRLRSRRLSRLRRKPSLQLRLLTEEQIAHNKESRTTSSTRRTRRNTSRKWKLNSKRSMMASSLMDKNLIPSARRIAGAEGHQQRTPKRSFSLSKSILNRSQRSDMRCSQERHESCEAEWCIQEHTAQRKVVAVEEQQKIVKKSLEIQVEEKQVEDIKN